MNKLKILPQREEGGKERDFNSYSEFSRRFSSEYVLSCRYLYPHQNSLYPETEGTSTQNVPWFLTH